MFGQTPGQVIGTAGGGLVNAGWAANAAVAAQGAKGERATAQVLDQIARRMGGPTVIHDVMIPIPGIRANIDHLVIAGQTVHIIDSKTWAPGTYFTTPKFLGAHTYRDYKRFKPAEKKTMAMAHQAIGSFLKKAQVDFSLATPLLVVWPASTRKAFDTRHFGMKLRVPGATVMHASKLKRRAERAYNRPADPALVSALVRLLPDSRGRDMPLPQPGLGHPYGGAA